MIFLFCFAWLVVAKLSLDACIDEPNLSYFYATYCSTLRSLTKTEMPEDVQQTTVWKLLETLANVAYRAGLTSLDIDRIFEPNDRSNSGGKKIRSLVANGDG